MYRNTLTASKPYERVAKSAPRKVSDDLYFVDSDTETLVSYRVVRRYVSRGSYVWECNCPQYAQHHECKHVNRVLIEMGAYLSAAQRNERAAERREQRLAVHTLEGMFALD